MCHIVNARQHLEAIRKMLPTFHSKTLGWAAGTALECKPPSQPLITRKDSAHFSPRLSPHAPNSTLKSCPIWLSMPFPSQASILPESLDVHTANQQEKPQPSCGAYPSQNGIARSSGWAPQTGRQSSLVFTREHSPELVTAIHLHLAGLAWLAESSRHVECRGPKARRWKCVRFVEMEARAGS
jgi:hypothetical protein